MKVQSTPITTQHVTASQGEERAAGEESIRKELAKQSTTILHRVKWCKSQILTKRQDRAVRL
eukprot:3918169-Amphidinium_carterae.1